MVRDALTGHGRRGAKRHATEEPGGGRAGGGESRPESPTGVDGPHRQTRLLEGDPQVVRMAGGGQGVAQADEAVLVQPEQALVEGLHAVVLALGDDLLELVGLVRVHALVEGTARGHAYLDGRDPDLPVD